MLATVVAVELALILAVLLAAVLLALVRKQRKNYQGASRTDSASSSTLESRKAEALTLISVQPSSQLPPHFEEWSAPSQVLSRINELISAAPSLFSPGRGLFRLSFPPEVMTHLRDGSYAMMQSADGGVRAIAVNEASGRVVAQGTLNGAGGNASSLLKVWQVMALVTAQHFLSDIQGRLKDIEVSLDFIRRHIEAEEFAKLEEAQRYAREVFAMLEAGDFGASEASGIVGELEAIDLRCAEILNCRLALLQDAVGDGDSGLQSGWDATVKRGTVSAIRFVDAHAQKLMVGSGFKEFQAGMAEFDRTARVLSLALAVRVLLVHLRTAMLMSPSRSQRRLDDLQRSLEEYGKVKQSFLIARESDLRAMESKFNLFGNKDEARAKMSEQIESIRASLDTTDVALTGYVRQVAEQNRLNPCEQGMQVIVSVDKSKRVTKVYRATPALTT